MTDLKSAVERIEASVDAGLRNLVRFGTQEQAEQAHRARERLRLAAMDQALANLQSRNEAILALVSSLQAIVDGLRRHPVGDVLGQFRSAVTEGQLLLDSVQQADEAAPAPAIVTEATVATASGAIPGAGAGAAPQPPPSSSPAEVRPSEPRPARPAGAAPENGATAKPADPSQVQPSASEASAGPDEADARPAAASDDLKLPPANEAFRAAILEGARRCGLAPCALAALIDAEAARRPDGGWDPNSANPRSSARGLTQFLSATWIEMARRSGCSLNAIARAKGCIDGNGEVVPSRRADLLDLRFDPEASILAAADYAKQNLDFLAAHGCVPGAATDDDKARIAYLAHHEGPGGARDFIKGTLSEERAERLLRVNAGTKATSIRAEHGSWRAGYTSFLNAYIDRKIRPARFRT